MKVRTSDGVEWARWTADVPRIPTVDPKQTVPGADSCAHCDADNPAWKPAPKSVYRPKPEIIYACKVCGTTTHHGLTEPDALMI